MTYGLLSTALTVLGLAVYLRARPMTEPQDEDFTDRKDFRMAQRRYFSYLVSPAALVVLALLSVSFFVAR